MEMLLINQLSKSFQDKPVLCGLDLSVPANRVFGFVGKNGAGKTTTMKAILGLLRVDGGEIYVDGEKVCYGETPTNRHVGYLPDVPEFYGFMTAKEYLMLCADCMEMPRAQAILRADELLEQVGLSGEGGRIRGYSRGMKQRLGIAQALLGRPKLLICDEPTSALDPIGRMEILDLLASVRHQTTVLFSTHILTDVERICTDVALLNEGKIAMQGSVEELKMTALSEAFCVTVVDSNQAKQLFDAHPSARSIEQDRITFSGGDDVMLEVMRHIVQSNIVVRSIERIEPSLETLFMGVVKK